MSDFIWGKIKFKKMPAKLESYQRDDIQIFFDREEKPEHPIFIAKLCNREVYFNIACGYEKVNLDEYGNDYLNCHESYFALFHTNFPKGSESLEPYYTDLYRRVKKLQDFIIELFDNPNIEKITYFQTDTGGENSTDDYEVVNWKINEFAEKFIETIKKNSYCSDYTPTIQLIFNK